mmetsp:Transcript_77004/g.202032  ORF Transcript_77004/g.202032 Transcript_77004/m.202032 type:complete len:227 (+) Transcript_77004:201-881(+)
MSFERRLANSSTIRRTRSSSGAAGSSTSAYSRLRACSTMSLRCSISISPPFLALLPWISMWPTRVKEGATRVVMAHFSTCILLGFRSWDLSWAKIILFLSGDSSTRCGATCARSASSTLGTGLSGSYQGRLVVSSPDTTRERARVVETPMACMASETRNSRTLERSTARPSAPRQKGVCPPPFSCSSQRRPPTTTSPTETARPSPYPLPFSKGQLEYISWPLIESA